MCWEELYKGFPIFDYNTKSDYSCNNKYIDLRISECRILKILKKKIECITKQQLYCKRYMNILWKCPLKVIKL